jgi:uncharacterized OB-fold protein
MDVREHVDGLRRGELRVALCRSCSAPAFPPPRVCSRCGATDPAHWITASGRGRLWSVAEFHRTYLPDHPAPYPVAVVELDEGPRLLSTLTDPRTPIGGAVLAVIDADGEPPRVVFRPESEGGSP